MKYFLFCLKMILLFTIVPAFSLAQQKNEGGIVLAYKDYISFATAPASKNPQEYFIAKLSKADFLTNKKSNRFVVIRQLDDSIFIIKDLHPLINVLPFYHKPANDNWKLSPAVLSEFIAKKYHLPAVFLVTVVDVENFKQWAAENSVSFTTTTALTVFTVKIKTAKDLNELLASAPVNYIRRSVIQHEIGHCIGMRHTDYMDRSYSCGGTATKEGASNVGAIFIPGTASGPDAASWMLACSNGGDRTFNSNDVIGLNYLYK